MTPRPTPFDRIFGEIADQRFAAIRDSVAADGVDARSRDRFVLDREAAALLRELVGEDGDVEALEAMVAFVHAAYLFWLDGRALVWLERPSLDRLLDEPEGPRDGRAAQRAYYLQVPAQRVWAEARSEAPPEPLDGCFVLPDLPEIAVVAVFGFRADREGFTVVGAAGPRVQSLARADGSRLFAPRFAGGAGAGLHSLAGSEELLELAYRVDAALGPNGAVMGTQRLSVL